MSDPESDAQFLEWLATTLPAYETQKAERLKECAKNIRQLVQRMVEFREAD